MRKKNRTAAGLRVHRLQDMLDESIVGAALRRKSKEVASVGIVREEVAVPLLDRVRRIGKHYIECLELASLKEARTKQCIVVDDSEFLHAMQEKVHPRDRGSKRILLLTVCLDLFPIWNSEFGIRNWI